MKRILLVVMAVAVVVGGWLAAVILSDWTVPPSTGYTSYTNGDGTPRQYIIGTNAGLPLLVDEVDSVGRAVLDRQPYEAGELVIWVGEYPYCYRGDKQHCDVFYLSLVPIEYWDSLRASMDASKLVPWTPVSEWEQMGW